MSRSYRFVIDAGHGGKDPGAVTPPNSEAKINLDVALALSNYLRSLGHTVLLTRAMDVYVSPADRAWAIQHAGADLAISLHCNSAGNPAATGCEVIYRDPLEKKIGDRILPSITKKFPTLVSRGTKHDQRELQRSLAVLNNPEEVLVVLVEMGFISNATDCEALLATEAMAQAIGEGALQSLQAL